MAVNRIRGAFAAPKKGETFELRAGLVSQYAYERKEAIQKTIMAMTLGKDVSALFPDVLKNIATADLDQKKLVYLYLMCVWPFFHIARCSPSGSCRDRLLRTTDTRPQELRKITPRSVHIGRQYVCTRLRRPESTHKSVGDQDDGLYPSR